MKASNVFADIGVPNAQEHQIKADFVLCIGALIRERGLTQTQAAEIIGIAQPDISNLLRGRFAGFSLERLIGFINALGRDVKINIARTPTPHRKQGRTLVTA